MPSSENAVQSAGGTTMPRKPWEPMNVHYVAHISEVVQTAVGGGKTAAITGDPGEPQKTRPEEP